MYITSSFKGVSPVKATFLIYGVIKMYKINDYVVYKKEVCKIVDIKNNYIKDNDYYTLIPLSDETLKIDIPVLNNTIRDLISKEKLEKIILSIPNIDIIESDDKLLENEYKKLLSSEKHEDLIKIIKTTYLRNKNRLDNNKRISDKDNFYFEKAEKLLYTEFSIVLNMSYEDTKEYVLNSVKALV